MSSSLPSDQAYAKAIAAALFLATMVSLALNAPIVESAATEEEEGFMMMQAAKVAAAQIKAINFFKILTLFLNCPNFRGTYRSTSFVAGSIGVFFVESA